MLMAALLAKSESPKTTTRASGLGASAAASGFGAGVAAVVGAATAAAIEIGPGLSPLSSSSFAWPVVRTVLMSVSAQLRAPVWTKDCAVWPLTPPGTGVADRASGYAVRRLKRSVIG